MKGFILGDRRPRRSPSSILIKVLPASMIDFEGETPQLVLLAVVVGVVNAVIKPIVKILSFPISMMTLGLFGLRDQRRRCCWASRTLADSVRQDRLHDRRLAGARDHGRHDRRRRSSRRSLLGVISTVVGLVVHD